MEASQIIEKSSTRRTERRAGSAVPPGPGSGRRLVVRGSSQQRLQMVANGETGTGLFRRALGETPHGTRQAPGGPQMGVIGDGWTARRALRVPPRLGAGSRGGRFESLEQWKRTVHVVDFRRYCINIQYWAWRVGAASGSRRGLARTPFRGQRPLPRGVRGREAAPTGGLSQWLKVKAPPSKPTRMTSPDENSPASSRDARGLSTRF